MTDYQKQLAIVKAGQTIIIMAGYYQKQQEVQRTSKTQIILKNGQRFSKSSGTQIGGIAGRGDGKSMIVFL